MIIKAPFYINDYKEGPCPGTGTLEKASGLSVQKTCFCQVVGLFVGSCQYNHASKQTDLGTGTVPKNFTVYNGPPEGNPREANV